MRVILRWTCSQARSGSDVRLARFILVLRAAQRTYWYQPLLEAAGLATPEALAAVTSVEHTLVRLPAVDLNKFRSSPAAFESPGRRHATSQPFRSPLEHLPRTAILMQGFEQSSGVRVIARNWSNGLKHFAATALAGPVAALREIATAIESGLAEAPPLKHFVVPFTLAPEGALSAHDRDRFWRVFRVPVFEQRLGFDGQVIAYECEAHDGLHILPERAAFEETLNSEFLLTSLTDLRYPTLRVGTQVAGAIQRDCCDCGHATARLMSAKPLPAPGPLAAMAAAC